MYSPCVACRVMSAFETYAVSLSVRSCSVWVECLRESGGHEFLLEESVIEVVELELVFAVLRLNKKFE